jgi:hypothetical protein
MRSAPTPLPGVKSVRNPLSVHCAASRWLGSGEGSVYEVLVARLVRLVDCPRPEVLLKVRTTVCNKKIKEIHVM